MNADTHGPDEQFLSNAINSFIRIAAIVILGYWCYSIVSPFLSIVIWAVIISVAIYPLHESLATKLGGRAKTSATILVIVGLAIILVPVWYLADSSISGLRHVGEGLRSGTLTVPPPNQGVADWPLIGDKVYAFWHAAATNLEQTLTEYHEQLRGLGERISQLATGGLIGTLQFVVSIIIAGVLLLSARGGYDATRGFATSLAGEPRGSQYTDLAIQTIRSVFKGVLGVAIIQTLLATIGLVVIGLPAPGLWAGAILVLAIVQLPPILILGPIAIWYFSVAEPLPAIVFLVYSVVVSFSDAVLKPMLLGRGVETPMLVILIGAIGGAITAGVVGLFVGAVILALGYELLMAWMGDRKAPVPVEPAES